LTPSVYQKTPNHEKPIEGEKPKVIQVSKTDRTIWLPDANRGIAVLGGTGSGETYSVIALCRSHHARPANRLYADCCADHQYRFG